MHRFLRRPPSPTAGFTTTDALATVVLAGLLAAVLVAGLGAALLEAILVARSSAQAAECAVRLRSFGEASSLYEAQLGSFAPCDPHRMMYPTVPGAPRPRDAGSSAEKMDPAHGWLALYGMGIIPSISDENDRPWQAVPYGFSRVSKHNPGDLWQGFFCPVQNRRNTTSPRSPELDPNDVHEVYPVHYKYASGYIVNRLLRSASTTSKGPATRWPARPDDAWEANYTDYDNVYGSCVVFLDAGAGPRKYHLQALATDELVQPAQTMYMADSLDHHTKRSKPAQERFRSGQLSAGLWHCPYLELADNRAVILGARHAGKANVLYADNHVSRGNQTPRNRRGGRVIASTFADFVDEQGLGSQHHLLPGWRQVAPNP